MSDEFSIIGCGARTPLGFDRQSSAAAARAGIAAIAEHPSMVDRFGEPIKVARDAALDPDLAGPERLLALAVPAASEALAPLKGLDSVPRLAIAVSFGEERPYQDSRTGEALGKGLRDALHGSIAIERVQHWMGGHAGGIVAMEDARRLITEGSAEIVLAGGVDSYLSRDTLEWLDENEQLHSEENIYGFCPGEAAGFVLIARTEMARRLGLVPLISLVSVASGIEKNLIKTEDIVLGDGLSAAFRTAAEPLGKGETIDRIICDMNGERYRGNEYGFAALKASGLFKNAAAFEAPADCWGDVGAASGPLYVSLVVEAEGRGYAMGPLSLIWASSEGGRRGRGHPPTMGSGLMPSHVTVNGLGLTYKSTVGISTATLPDVCKTPSPAGPVPIPYPNIANQSSLKDGTTTVKAKGQMIAVKGSQYGMSNGDEAGVAGGVKSSVNMKATDWITYSFDVKMDGQNACRHTDKKFHNNQNTVDLAGNIDPNNPPPGLTPHELALWKPCAEQHEKYKKIQGEEAAYGTARYNALESKLEQESKLLAKHPLAPKILTADERKTFNRLNAEKINRLEKLAEERQKYIDMGCDDVRWPDKHGKLATTTAEERRADHKGELKAVRKRLKAMEGLFA